MDDEQIVVAYRTQGLHIIRRSRGGPPSLEKVGKEEEEIRGIRAILPLRGGEGSSTLWILLTDRGELFRWSGSPEDRPRLAEDLWGMGRRPSLISDSCLLRGETARRLEHPAAEILIATDRGLYLLFFEGPDLRLRRLALSGLSATPMVLAYTSSMLAGDTLREYLWVTDLQGDSHLFWSDGSKPFGERRFWRSGVHHSRNETLACALLPEVREPSSGMQELPESAFFVVQVRRDDQIVLGRYWNPNQKERSDRAGELHKDLDLRDLLNFGIYKGESGAQAIRTYLKDRFTNERQDEKEVTQDKKKKGWWYRNDAAIVAELFEYLAEDEDRRRVLLESLRAPYAEAAQAILSSAKSAKDTSRLWRLALLGILHRAPGDQTSSYLGLLRWLRHRQVELPEKGFEEISRRLDDDLLLVRKWGLRGGVNHDREDLVGPQLILQAQEDAAAGHSGDQQELERLRWERLTYRAELFGRNVNLIHENKDGRLRGRTAWATAVFPYPGGTLVAVSWIWGGVELFDLEAAGAQGPELKFLRGDYGVDATGAGPHTLRKDRLDKSEIVPAKYGYSRVVHLGKVDDRTYLLSAPASERLSGGRAAASLFVWPLPDVATMKRGEEVKPWEISLEEVGPASIYSLLDLGEGRLVAGLRGEGQQAFLTLIEIGSQEPAPGARVSWKIPVSIGPSVTPPPADEEPAAREEARPPGRNRIWSLALISEPFPDQFHIAFGCDSGEIYEVTIDWKTKNLTEAGPNLVGRMGSPVKVLACRPREDGIIRVFAGGEDGAIVAWQDISLESRPGEPLSPRYGTLWATSEQGAIARIHPLKMEGDYAVLAVTREGRYVVFDDRARIDSPPNPGRPSRMPVPGSRHGRRPLRCAAFASSLIEDPGDLGSYWGQATELEGFAALLLATDDGRLRLVSLHSPEARESRKREYQKIVDLWHEVLQEPLDFRLTEAAHKASPNLSLIVVRHLLDHSLKETRFSSRTPAVTLTVEKALEESPWCLPRHLRPLFRLRILWDRLHTGEAAGTPEDYKLFESLLSAALERAWRLNDLGLFQEICQVVLRQANSGLYRAAEAPADEGDGSTERPRSTQEVASNIFLSVLNAVEHSLPRWLSADRQREARARIAVAKHLVDGETVRVLLREVAREEREEKARSAQGADRPQGEGSGEAGPGTFRRVLGERIRAVRELVNKRHPLVSLESLRAANLSLTRMCRSLVETRAKLSGSSDAYEPRKAGGSFDACEVWWPVFKDYSDELITAAVRAFRTPLELNDALAHEFSRTFALFICACPSATLKIESLLTERLQISDPELEEGIFYRVLAQLKVLRAIGIGAPAWADELLRLGTHFPPEGWNWTKSEQIFPKLSDLEVFRYLGGENLPANQLAGSVGEENAENLANIRTVYRILRKLEQLTVSLETTAEGLDLSEDWRREMLGIAGALKSDHLQSKGFLERAFAASTAGSGFPTSSPIGTGDLRKVRPEMVRLSQPLARWAKERLDDIDRSERDGRLYQPEVTTYSRVFRRLARAAENFPTSAAVQTNVVQGVLGHHLLEDLDEHALELEEIAEVLNPRQVWDFRDQGRRHAAALATKSETSTAEEFARYLLGRASRAESIPKNLRLLQALLGSQEEGADEKPFDDLVQPYLPTKYEEFAWQVDPASRGQAGEVSWKEARYLSLVLAELDQNQRKHAWPGNWQKKKPCPDVSFPAQRSLLLRFPFVVLEAETPGKIDPNTNIGRLRELEEKGFSLIEPNRNPGVSSSGTGFYLADLAAAIASWRLDLKCPPPIKKPGVAWFEVTLTPCEDEKEKDDES
ncbi:MAG TPA: hypothetical protein VGH73_10305 [Thermoanaerobaculia bacterium]